MDLREAIEYIRNDEAYVAGQKAADEFDALRKAADDALRYLEDTGESCRTTDLIAALRRALGKEQ